jgi:epoxyqueuosine reductase
MEMKERIRERLSEFVAGDPGNAMPAHGGMKMYDAPLMGVASAADPYFWEFQKPGVVGPRFTLPQGWLPGAKSVIAYFLPFTKAVRDSNRAPGLPSEEWVSARIDGERFNDAVRAFLTRLLKGMGADALAPALDPRFGVEDRISNWSERHAAFAAGLGTFGLHRALITEKGSAGRLGSVVTTLELEPDRRSYDTYYAYCPFLSSGRCGACIRRCPPAAISREGKDHAVCNGYMDREITPRFAPRYGCAKCNVAVPCESRIPKP